MWSNCHYCPCHADADTIDLIEYKEQERTFIFFISLLRIAILNTQFKLGIVFVGPEWTMSTSIHDLTIKLGSQNVVQNIQN